jgi:hypothetical protein
MSQSPEDEKAMAWENSLAEWSDARLVAAAYVRGAIASAAIEVEMMRRLKESLNAGNESAAALTKRLERLNVWLLWVTVVIGAMTVVQIGLAVVQIAR